MVEQHTVRQAAEHQAAVLPGPDDNRLQLIAERLERESSATAKARLTVVQQEMRNRGIR